MRSFLVKPRLESLRILCLDHAADAHLLAARASKRLGDQGVGVRSLIEKFEALRLGDVIRSGENTLTIAINDDTVAIQSRHEECTWGCLCMLFYSLRSRGSVRWTTRDD